MKVMTRMDFINCFKGLMDRSLYNEVYSFISVKSHNDEYYFSKGSPDENAGLCQ